MDSSQTLAEPTAKPFPWQYEKNDILQYDPAKKANLSKWHENDQIYNTLVKITRIREQNPQPTSHRIDGVVCFLTKAGEWSKREYWVNLLDFNFVRRSVPVMDNRDNSSFLESIIQEGVKPRKGRKEKEVVKDVKLGSHLWVDKDDKPFNSYQRKTESSFCRMCRIEKPAQDEYAKLSRHEQWAFNGICPMS